MAGNEPSTKRCTKCSEWKPTSDFRKDRQKRDGLGSWCRACSKVSGLAWMKRNPDRVKANRDRWLAANADHRKQWRVAYEAANREKLRKKQNARRAAKPQQYRQAEHRRYWENLDAARERNRIKAERSRKQNPQRHRLNQKRAYMRNPMPWKIAADRRRARLEKVEGHHTAEDIQRIFRLQRGRCGYCRIKLDRKSPRDHIIAISKGGSNAASNIQLLCKPCNSKKKDKDPLVFARQLGRLL